MNGPGLPRALMKGVRLPSTMIDRARVYSAAAGRSIGCDGTSPMMLAARTIPRREIVDRDGCGDCLGGGLAAAAASASLIIFCARALSMSLDVRLVQALT